MASLGHVAVGMAFGRLFSARTATPAWKAMVAFSALSLLPDADVLGFRFGVHYADAFGHRGASHSFAFAALVAAVAAALSFRDARRTVLLTAALVFATVASHPLLDCLTDGGLGCALLFPFDQTRYFAPVTPLPVAPIGRGMLSARGLYVLAVEAAAFLPCWAVALWPRRRAAMLAL